MKPIQNLINTGKTILTDRQARFVHDFIALAGGQIISKVVGFAAFAYIARSVSSATYGQIEYVVGLAILFATIAECGLGAIGVRRIAVDKSALPVVAAEIPTLRLILAALVTPVMLLVPIAMGMPPNVIMLTVLYAVSLFGLAIHQEWLLQSRNHMFQIALAHVARAVVFCAILVFFVSDANAFTIVGAAEIISVVALIGISLWTQQQRITPFRLLFRARELFDLAKSGVSLGAANLIWALQQYSPLFIITYIAGSVETAWFAAPHRIVMAVLVFSQLYHFNLYPTLAELYVKNRERYLKSVAASLRAISFVAIGGALTVMLLAEPLITIAFGAKFSQSAMPFAVMIWAVPFTMISGHGRWALMAAEKQHYIFYAQSAAAVTGIVSAFALIPSMNATGGAAAVVVMCLTVILVGHFSASRFIPNFPSLREPILLTPIALGLWWATTQVDAPMLIEAALALALYALAGLVVIKDVKEEILTVIYIKKSFGEG